MPCICPWFKQKEDLTSPLIETPDGAPARLLRFKHLYIDELDAIFNDFENALNPFVKNRIALEKAEKSFKLAVQSIERIDPEAKFKEYAKALKTSLAHKGLRVKIERGVVMLEGEAARIGDAEKKCKDAMEKILAAADDLYDMVPGITDECTNAAARAENLDVKHIAQRECSGIKETIKTATKFKDNVKMMKKAPKMVDDFCKEVKKIVHEIMDAFEKGNDEEEGQIGQAKQQTSGGYAAVTEEGHQESTGKHKEQYDGGEMNAAGTDKRQKESKEKQNGAEKKKIDNKEKESYHKALKFEKIGIIDIDSLFTDLASTINPFVTSREKMQKAREKFEKAFVMIDEFDGEKEFKEYLKVLKKKAEQGKIRIRIDVGNTMRIDSVTGVPVPKPIQDVVDCLNAMNSCALQVVDLEPDVQRGIERVLNEIQNIRPETDLRRALKLRELPKLPTKIKKFNNNRKTAQEAPGTVADFFKYIKQIILDVKEFLEEEE
eukprot:gene18643-20524_t